MVNALAIWEELAGECAPAARYYKQKTSRPKEIVLKRGAADFDCKCFPDDLCEQPRYRSDLYVSRGGYMDMHIRQNLAVLKHCFGGGIPQPLLWIDFGCGPMTSGLALAEHLAAHNPNYKSAAAYFGIDASRNMVAKAQYINGKHRLFAPERFKIMQARHLDANKIDSAWAREKTIVLCCSFVLAPGTFKANSAARADIQSLADQWKSFAAKHHCPETFVLYLNPKNDSLHTNWHAFQQAMCSPAHSIDFRYTGGDLVPLRVPNLLNPITYAKIHGVRQ